MKASGAAAASKIDKTKNQDSGQQVSEAPSSFFAVLEKFAKGSAMFIATLYALGLLLTNHYLMAYGISDFSSLRPKYIITGGWIFMLMGSAALPCCLFMLSIGRHLSAPEEVAFKIVLRSAATYTVVGVVVGSGVWTVLLMLLTSDPQASFKSFNPPGFDHIQYTRAFFSASACAFLLTIIWILVQSPKKRFHVFVYSALFMPGTVYLALLPMESIYVRVPEALGGGRPLAVKLLMTSAGTEFCKQSGIPLDREWVGILYQNDRELLVRAHYQTNEGDQIRIVKIDRSLVAGILLKD